MCTTCGCGQGETRIEGEHEHEHVMPDGTVYRHVHASGGDHAHDAHTHFHRHTDGTVHEHPHLHEGEHAHAHPGAAHEHEHRHADGTVHRHDHAHDGEHGHGSAPEHHHHETGHAHGDLHYGLGPARAHAPGMTQSRMVQIEQDILSRNDAYAARNREWLRDRGVFTVNLVSSPGAGKTTLLVRTIEALREAVPVCVVEGDQQTSMDADRVRATGAPAIQVNTGKGCHLDAAMVGRALERLAPPDGSLLMVENVGNLVCPAAFDLGEAYKVVVLSVTEGEDKPLKYPDMFHAAKLMLLNKIDLLPYVQFDVDRCLAYARRVNPEMAVLPVSATTGEGLGTWLEWLLQGVREARAGRAETLDALRRRIADLESQIARLKDC
jgi:hydrogenase nickel incorporation protein HypB